MVSNEAATASHDAGQQMSQFTFLGCGVRYQIDNDITNKFHTYQLIRDTINRALCNKTTRNTKLKFYRVIENHTKSLH